jgi:hypothetical protein
VPIIAIFTKYDQLIDRTDYDMDESRCSGLDEATRSKLVRKDADVILQEVCIGPFEEFVQKKIPHVTVSSGSYLHFHHLLMHC